MSFGFAIGDFITVGKLAWTLYRECYQIARGAPQEFSLLVNELSTLSNSLTILREEAKDPESTLRRAGDDRIRMVNEMVGGIEETLKRLRETASKYNILGSSSKTKRIWAKFKWSAELCSIDRLRNKLIYHNTVMNLLLTSVGNSSLQRLEISHQALADNVLAIKECIASNQAVVGSKMPALSVVGDDLMGTTISASLMMNAESSQAWSTIGLDQWIGAGKWWLYRAQLELHTIKDPGQSVAVAAYANLIKAGWILADVIPGHPQYSFISASRGSEIGSLSTEVKNEFSRITALAMVVPALGELSSQHLRLWESIPDKAPILRPCKGSQDFKTWRADGGEHVLFRAFASHSADQFPSKRCILLFLVHENAKAARLVVQDQYGDIVMAISIHKHVNLDHPGIFQPVPDSTCVYVNEQRFILDCLQEAKVLRTMIEATEFYLSGRRADHGSLEDLKAYMLLTAVKNQEELAVAKIRQQISATDDFAERNQKGSLALLAVSMALQWIKGRPFQNDRDDHYSYTRSRLGSLLDWAVVCNHTTLIEFLVGEIPVSDDGSPPSRSWDQFRMNSLMLSAAFGNEAVVRWLLDNTVRDMGTSLPLASSLDKAIRPGHANAVAALINAGAYPGKNVAREVLRSPLSEPVIHAILALIYATQSGSESSLRAAADRGHEGAIVLLPYTLMKEMDKEGYLSMAHDSGFFEQVVAAFAKLPNILPAFALTLMTAERRRTQVLLEVNELPPIGDVMIYLNSYHAYIEDVPEGLSAHHKKAIKVETIGEFTFTVLHQEESLIFSARTDESDKIRLYLEINGHKQELELCSFLDSTTKLPID